MAKRLAKKNKAKGWLIGAGIVLGAAALFFGVVGLIALADKTAYVEVLKSVFTIKK